MPAPQIDEVELDRSIAYGAIGGPGYLTEIVSPSGGAEYHNALWPLGRGGWDVGYGVRTVVQAQGLIAFFRCRKGMGRGFRFMDPLDHDATLEPIVNTGSNPLQLIKTYADGSGQSEIRNIWKPVQTTVAIFHTPSGGAQSQLTEGVDYSIDYTKGAVTFTSLDTTGAYVWTGQFCVPVWFAIDKMDQSIDDFDTVSWIGIRIVEMPPSIT